MSSYWLLLLIPVIYICGWIIWFIRTGGIPQAMPKVISFHKISSKPEFGGTFVTPCQFELFMRYIAQNGYSTVSMDRLLSEHNERQIAICFDDAYSSIYETAYPIMKNYGLTGAIAPIVNYIGKDSSWDSSVVTFPHMKAEQIREMSDSGFDVISHTMSHPDLRRINKDMLFNELNKSKQFLANLTGRDVDYLLYPYGLHNDRVKRAARMCGYRGAFASYSERNDHMDRYAMGRNSMYIIDSVFDLSIILKRGPLLLYGHEEAKGRIINWFARFSGVIRL